MGEWSLVFPLESDQEGWAWTGVHAEVVLAEVPNAALDDLVESDERFGVPSPLGELKDEDIGFFDSLTRVRFALICDPSADDEDMTAVSLRIDQVVPETYGALIFVELAYVWSMLGLGELVDREELEEEWLDCNARAMCVALQQGFEPVLAPPELVDRRDAWNSLIEPRREAIREHFELAVEVHPLNVGYVDGEPKTIGILRAGEHQFVPEADCYLLYGRDGRLHGAVLFETAAEALGPLRDEPLEPFSFATAEQYDGEDFEDEEMWGRYITPITDWTQTSLASPGARSIEYAIYEPRMTFTEDDLTRAREILASS